MPRHVNGSRSMMWCAATKKLSRTQRQASDESATEVVAWETPCSRHSVRFGANAAVATHPWRRNVLVPFRSIEINAVYYYLFLWNKSKAKLNNQFPLRQFLGSNNYFISYSIFFLIYSDCFLKFPAPKKKLPAVSHYCVFCIFKAWVFTQLRVPTRRSCDDT